jgi:glycosyltransferase involved in cell wall biosynthesis
MKPKVSIVTINYNMRDELDATIQSVLSQTYANLEYVVIDGGSTDGSVEIIKRSTARIHHWVSERDRGLYHAMNKGTAASTGDWVLFMNSGDRFVDNEVVADVFKSAHDDADLLYGHSLRFYKREGVERVILAEPPDILPWGMNCSHQSLFARRSLLMEFPFSENLIAADFEFLLTAKVEGKRFKMVDRVIAANSTGGMSDQNRILSIKQRWIILRRHGLITSALAIGYAWFAVRGIMGSAIRRVLPMKIISWILRYKPMTHGR